MAKWHDVAEIDGTIRQNGKLLFHEIEDQQKWKDSDGTDVVQMSTGMRHLHTQGVIIWLTMEDEGGLGDIDV